MKLEYSWDEYVAWAAKAGEAKGPETHKSHLGRLQAALGLLTLAGILLVVGVGRGDAEPINCTTQPIIVGDYAQCTDADGTIYLIPRFPEDQLHVIEGQKAVRLTEGEFYSFLVTRGGWTSSYMLDLKTGKQIMYAHEKK